MPRSADHHTRRRADQMVGGLLALIGVAALLVAILALQHPKGGTVAASKQTVPSGSSSPVVNPTVASSAAPSPRPSKTSPSPTPSPVLTNDLGQEGHDVPIIVLNNTNKTGLAQTMRDQFVAGGWKVTSVGNMSDNIVSTCAYFDPVDAKNLDAAQRLQAEFPAIKRVKEKYPGMPSGPLIVVLTSDYKG